MIDGDWMIVFLDSVILANLALLAFWFHHETAGLALRLISIAFVLIGISKIALVTGDILIAFDYTEKDFWLLVRPWRALTWRIGASIGYSLISWTLVYGRFTDGRTSKTHN